MKKKISGSQERWPYTWQVVLGFTRWSHVSKVLIAMRKLIVSEKYVEKNNFWPMKIRTNAMKQQQKSLLFSVEAGRGGDTHCLWVESSLWSWLTMANHRASIFLSCTVGTYNYLNYLRVVKWQCLSKHVRKCKFMKRKVIALKILYYMAQVKESEVLCLADVAQSRFGEMGNR